MNKLVVRVKGGIGNQLFCYAAARALALRSEAELVIDDITGFARDCLYNNKYELDRFSIQARKATRSERLEPLERYRRGVFKLWSRRQPFAKRRYLEQEHLDFDPRIIDLKVRGSVYLDGLWQSEGYFIDKGQVIREDLRIIPPSDDANLRMYERIDGSRSVAIHVRWFDAPVSEGGHNASADYYRRAIAMMDREVASPHYFIFSDNTEAARIKLKLDDGRFTFVSCNQGADRAYADLWLMTHCRHFIIANSTFSWWGAWLGDSSEKIAVAPRMTIDGKTAWGFKGLLPAGWIEL